ncbi:VWA domain-containing protein [Archangium violaceum]|uniref:vWA domain-containing protein n=1 Tax=Archangium violaceum TaxID=83451 RepID=UPI002B2B92AF|nr:VWA domain-containing protein [Archangium gephyra]
MFEDAKVEILVNRSERLPCVLVLDTSESMEGRPISELNEGLKLFEQELKADELASARVQVMVIAFGNNVAQVITPWVDAMDFEAPVLTARGNTPMGLAMKRTLVEIEQRKAIYRAQGISYRRPWIFLISDGEPNDSGWEEVAAACYRASGEGEKKAAIFPIGVQGANVAKLALFSDRGCKMLDGLKFRELFVWMSASVRAGSRAAAEASSLLAPVDAWARPVKP